MYTFARLCLLAGVAVGGTLSAVAANAAQFAITYTNPNAGISMSGILTTTPLGTHPDFANNPTPNTYLITQITGERNGVPITGIVPLGSADAIAWNNAGGSFDNLLYPNEPFVDLGGFVYKADGILYNLFYLTPTDFPGSSLPLPSYSEFALVGNNFVPNFNPPDELGNLVSVTLTPGPEPLTILGATTAIAIGGLLKRKHRNMSR
ncbi:MAG: PEP-CTERM sorting domain-containing protein [Synechocystis sp.]|nr:PEP-CTERM sorting domain-containing protein [Synechocystis sp.]